MKEFSLIEDVGDESPNGSENQQTCSGDLGCGGHVALSHKGKRRTTFHVSRTEG